MRREKRGKEGAGVGTKVMKTEGKNGNGTRKKENEGGREGIARREKRKRENEELRRERTQHIRGRLSVEQ